MFFYFLPGVDSKLTRAAFVRRQPLASILWDVCQTELVWQISVVQSFVRGSGPDGSQGMLLCVPGTQDVRIGYFPEEQTWVQTPTHWVGYTTESPPGPESLRRQFHVQSEEHCLGDGNVWLCPIVRRHGGNGLPTSMGVDPMTGEFQAKILPQYELAWIVAQEAWDVVAGRKTLKLSHALEMCVEALASNYRVGAVEVSLLKLINETNVENVIGALVDSRFLQELISQETAADQKKT